MGRVGRTTMAEELRITTRDSSLGTVLIARTSAGVAAVLLDDDRDALMTDVRQRFPGATLRPDDVTGGHVAERVVAQLDAPSSHVDIPLDLRGTEFQQRVWSALRSIPPGATTTYTALAARIGAPSAARAVATACAANHIAVIVPCHRVIRSDGALSGYRWGVERKAELLRRERAG